MKKIIKTKRNSAYVITSDFDPGYTNDGDFIEVTEWSNKEGFDLDIIRTSPAGMNLGGTQKIQITYGEFFAIKECVKSIENEK